MKIEGIFFPHDRGSLLKTAALEGDLQDFKKEVIGAVCRAFEFGFNPGPAPAALDQAAAISANPPFNHGAAPKAGTPGGNQV